ncbi:hypothetical protein B0J12DRAFT_214828 [Macrophomina phaseolina]|uniref:Uncharacterized protein n=1 Tax=Macrophomina phaseolina TaxID=35725 RepID=A0ABQ8G4E4_9PEZI|nr:hypothetical protein B0J12DRAFT_214828 [Macrophomina phaseolina]
MDSPVADSSIVAFSEAGEDETRAASAPIVDRDTDPLLTSEERKQHHLPERASDGHGGIREEEEEAKLRWPVRPYSASADPVTRDRRKKRIENFIDKAKQRRTSYREPLRNPSDGGSIRRVRTAPTPVRRRSSSAVTNLLWLARPRSKDSGAESLLRRVGHHIRSRPTPAESSPEKTPSEESIGSSRSAPEVPISTSSSSSSMNDYSRLRHHYNYTPALHLCTYRTSSPLKTNSSSSDHGSTSPSSAASMKSACADTTTTLTDVHVVRVPQDEANGTIISGQATLSPSMHVIESGHGSYHVVWGGPSPPQLSTSNVDRGSIAPNESVPKSPSPASLQRVNSKLEEWSFAARECTALDTSRSHPHFRSYVEVYQDDEDPQLDMADYSDALFMTPPNSERPTPGSTAWQSRRSSQGDVSHSNSIAPVTGQRSGTSSSTLSPSEEQQLQRSEYIDRPYGSFQHDDGYLVPSGYYSPRPNRPLTAFDRFNSQSRSLSSLSNTSDMSDNAASLLSRHRDSVVMMPDLYSEQIGVPVGNPWAHRDSVALAKERMRKKHVHETDDQLVGGVGILKGVSTGGFERTVPLDIPRLQQITYVGVLSPIADSSPPNSGDHQHDRKIDQMAETAQLSDDQGSTVTHVGF